MCSSPANGKLTRPQRGNASRVGSVPPMFQIVPICDARDPGFAAVPGRRGDKDEGLSRDEKAPKEATESASANATGDAAKARRAPGYPPPDDESAATGIGRNVSNGVQWIKMELDSSPAGEVAIRYEYRAALVRLGIIPGSVPRPDVLDRREKAAGFEPKYCPEP